ncbi:unnamed protein product [Vicia faba]|uniref:Uncharacterized protein n=1 Tax=Vicia faba TaxID=3906 RepID=A0AAV0Z0E7_VICFA|nr:unnamed protein product [Vicia faba]
MYDDKCHRRPLVIHTTAGEKKENETRRAPREESRDGVSDELALIAGEGSRWRHRYAISQDLKEKFRHFRFPTTQIKHRNEKWRVDSDSERETQPSRRKRRCERRRGCIFRRRLDFRRRRNSGQGARFSGEMQC